MTSSVRPHIVFVFGMGRSGTSALARVLSMCGGTLPDSLLSANEGNPEGYWEPQRAIDLNNEILYRHGATWFDPTLRVQGEIVFTNNETAACIERIKTFLGALPEAPLLVIKEPRITALADFWFEAARQVGFAIAIVVPVRHPAEVTASLGARDRTSRELSSALWLKYNLLAERKSRGLPRVFVAYANLLQDWRTEMSRVSRNLSLDLLVRDEAAIDTFLKEDLRRQRHGEQVPDPFGQQWCVRVHTALCAAARDEPLDTSVLDNIYDSYRACERTFRISLDDFRARFGAPVAGDPTPR